MSGDSSQNLINSVNIYSKVSGAQAVDKRTAQTVERVKLEVEVQLAKRKVELLQDVLTYDKFSQQEKNALQTMLNDAQKEFEQLKQKANVSGN